MISHGTFYTFIETVTLCVPMALIPCVLFFPFFGHARVLSHFAMDWILIFFSSLFCVWLFSMVSRFLIFFQEWSLVLLFSSLVLLLEVDVKEVGDL